MISGYSATPEKPGGATPPARTFIKKIISLIYDMTKINMRAEILAAAKVFRGLKFFGVYADCWTSRAGKGFLCIDITFIYFNPLTGDIRLVTMTLACAYMRGSHNAENIAAFIKKAIICSTIFFFFVICKLFQKCLRFFSNSESLSICPNCMFQIQVAEFPLPRNFLGYREIHAYFIALKQAQAVR